MSVCTTLSGNGEVSHIAGSESYEPFLHRDLTKVATRAQKTSYKWKCEVIHTDALWQEWDYLSTSDDFRRKGQAVYLKIKT